MVRGNWQRRVERTEARRIAAKQQKEQRRNKRINGGVIGETEEFHKASYQQLVDWLDANGGILLASYANQGSENQDHGTNGYVVIDLWTEDLPNSRQEYQIAFSALGNEEEEDYFSDEGPSKGRVGKGKQKEKDKPRGKYHKSKGKSHPNARNKSGKHVEENDAENGKSVASSNTASKLCANDFYFGRDKCAGSVAPKSLSKKGGRSRSNSFGAGNEAGCSFHHYHQFPKAKRIKSVENRTPSTHPLTLAQVLNGKYQPHPNKQTQDGSLKLTVSLPVKIREFILQSAFDAATTTPLRKPFASSLGAENIGGNDLLIPVDVEGENDKTKQTAIDVIYHSRVFVAAPGVGETEANDESDDEGNERTCSSDDENVSHDESFFDDGKDDRGKHQGKESCDSGRKPRSNGVSISLEKILLDENISQASLVYLAIQGVLIYDRHRGGLLISSFLEGFLLRGEDIDENAFISSKEPAPSQEALQIHEQLTHHVLDEILSYLDDEAAGMLPQVCPAWNDEIGKRSPQLWKMLLGRHGWPNISREGPADSARNAEGSYRIYSCNSHRHAFVAHYSAIRDIRAMVLATNQLKNGSTTGSINAGVRGRSGSISNNKHGIEYAMQVFKATKGAPVLDLNGRNSCMVKVWNEKNTVARVGAKALVSYADDCTLRLFEAVRSSQGFNTINSGNSPIICRQVVCVRVAPSTSKKKNNCDLSSMDLDDNLVACLVEETQVENDSRSIVIPWMTVIPREDLSCAGNEGILDEESVQSFDLRAAIFDHILVGKCSTDDNCSSSYDALHEPLHNYLSIFDGDTSEITISVTPKIIACGKGHFLFHAFISIPQYSEFDDNDDEHTNRIHPPSNGNRLFLFSTCKHGAIVKSVQLDVHPSSVGLFASRPVRRRASETTNAAMCTSVVAIVRNTPLMVSVQVQNSGEIEIKNKLMMEGDQALAFSCTHAVVMSSDIILASNPGPENDCVLHFQSDSKSDAPMSEIFHSVSFGGPGSKLKKLFAIQNDYVVAVVATNTTLNGNGGDDEEHIDFDGHWFGNDEESNTAFVFHIPTRRELYRTELPSDPISVDSLGNTLAINVSSLGFVLTGLDTREVGRISLNERLLDDTIMSPSAKTPKPKKKRLASKTGKKDGFARGMSLRG